jgi:diaminohydroxyphosphoribosylaminopyrimidine deaminase/5-amino-6-(5-phosphoribosylamino)uracil reductase
LAGDKELPSDRQIWKRDPLVISTIPRELPGGVLELVEGVSLPEPRATAGVLAKRGYLDLLLEGGPAVAAAWWSSGVVNAGVVYVGSRIGGGAGRSPMSGIFETIEMARPVSIVDVRMVGSDVRIDFT